MSRGRSLRQCPARTSIVGRHVAALPLLRLGGQPGVCVLVPAPAGVDRHRRCLFTSAEPPKARARDRQRAERARPAFTIWAPAPRLQYTRGCILTRLRASELQHLPGYPWSTTPDCAGQCRHLFWTVHLTADTGGIYVSSRVGDDGRSPTDRLAFPRQRCRRFISRCSR